MRVVRKLHGWTRGQLREVISYDPVTGHFIWLASLSPRIKIGDKAGSIDGNGYFLIQVDGVLLKAHRLAWFWMTGEWPEDQIDHINRVRSDNKWENLRLATQSQNQTNVPLRKDNTSAARGVSWHKKLQQWRVRFGADDKKRHVACFSNKTDAAICYNYHVAYLFSGHASLNKIDVDNYIHD